MEFSLTELLLIAVVALVLIGPQDLPKVLATLVRAWRQVHDVVAEVRRGVDTLIEESGVKDVERDITTLIDQDGNLQRTYDISEFLEDKSGEKVRILTELTEKDLHDPCG